MWALGHGGDLNANLVRFPVGRGVGGHVNDEVDVLFVGLAGSGVVAMDGEEHALSAGPLKVPLLEQERGPEVHRVRVLPSREDLRGRISPGLCTGYQGPDPGFVVRGGKGAALVRQPFGSVEVIREMQPRAGLEAQHLGFGSRRDGFPRPGVSLQCVEQRDGFPPPALMPSFAHVLQAPLCLLGLPTF